MELQTNGLFLLSFVAKRKCRRNPQNKEVSGNRKTQVEIAFELWLMYHNDKKFLMSEKYIQETV